MRKLTITAMIAVIAAGATVHKEKPKHRWNPLRAVKVLDQKLGQATVELSAVKSGNPRESTRSVRRNP